VWALNSFLIIVVDYALAYLRSIVMCDAGGFYHRR